MGTETVTRPKALMNVAGKPLLVWALEAFQACGIEDVVFVGGYRMGMVQRQYPQLTYVQNAAWSRTNILRSFMTAEAYMDVPFLVTYSDILYSPDVVRNLLGAPGPVAAVIDDDWQTRYEGRDGHPTSEAEKAVIIDGRISEIGKKVPDDRGHGEFIGMAAFDKDGIGALQQAYREAPKRGPYNEAKSLARAYLTDAIQDLSNRGVPIHAVRIRGGWIEIDTPLDLRRAREWKNSAEPDLV
jgi:choline kinase